MSALTILLERGFRRTQELRPATLIYRGCQFPCTPGNLDFFEQMHPDGAGFIRFRNQHVTILRSDLPTEDLAGNAITIEFPRGEKISVREDETGKVVELTIGGNNSEQPGVILLNLQATQA